MTVTNAMIPLGAVFRLEVTPDPLAGLPDELLRTRMEFELYQKLAALPAVMDLAKLDLIAAEDVKVLQSDVAQGKDRVVADSEFAVIGDALLLKAAGPAGALLFGYRWRLLPRQGLDLDGFLADTKLMAARVEIEVRKATEAHR